MSQRLKDKIAIITGASSGIGRETAIRFVKEGAAVVVADRNRRGGEETEALLREFGPDSMFVPVDVSKAHETQDMVQATIARFGRLDVLVNAAAVLILTPSLAEVDERDWDLSMSTNLKGVFFCCKYAIPAMLQKGGGSIVNIASMAGVQATTRSLPYSVSKAGVIHLTTLAASQYTSQGIRINCITPGPVDTPQFRGSTASSLAAEERRTTHPMERVGRPEEIANMILFLASDEASYVSGSTFVVDGGAYAAR